MSFPNAYTGPLGGIGDYPLALYEYVPNLGFNVFATVAFALTMFAHLFWLAKYRRTRSIQALMVLFCAWELVVYALRAYNSRNPYRERIFNAQYVMNMTGPTWLIIAKLLALMASLHYSADGYRSVMARPKLPPYLLIGLQVITFIILMVGTALWSTGNATLLGGSLPSHNPAHSKRVTLAGIILQLIQLTAFQGLLTWIMLRLFKRNTTGTAVNTYDADRGIGAGATRVGAGRLSRLFIALLFLTVGMVWTRTIFRTVETAQDWFGTAWSSELLYGLFEFAVVWVPSLIWAIRPFAHYIDDSAQSTTAFAHNKVRGEGTVGPAAV